MIDYSLCSGVARLLATPNKFSVSRPDLNHICMRPRGPFPFFFHYKIGSFYSHCLPGKAAYNLQKVIKSCTKHVPSFSRYKKQTRSLFDLIALMTREVQLSWKRMEEYGIIEY